MEGYCKGILPSNLTLLQPKDKRGLLKQAEELMHQGRQLVKGSTLSEDDRVQLLGRLDVRTACLLAKTGKNFPEQIEWTSVEQVAKARDMGSCARASTHGCAKRYIARLDKVLPLCNICKRMNSVF